MVKGGSRKATRGGKRKGGLLKFLSKGLGLGKPTRKGRKGRKSSKVRRGKGKGSRRRRRSKKQRGG
tara:strand:- start:286 stop:483 length:198 start_codon:yes stop_codon:yes gene_type:complete